MLNYVNAQQRRCVMARAKLSGSLLARKDAPPSASSMKISMGEGKRLIALTLKVDQARYEALRTLGARTRRSNQEILLEALDTYLQKTEES